MASLHRDPKGRSPYFYAAFALPNGKRAFRSTKQTTYKQAMRVALEWEKASELAGRGELTESASRKVLDLIRESVGDSALRTMTVRESVQKWARALPACPRIDRTILPDAFYLLSPLRRFYRIERDFHLSPVLRTMAAILKGGLHQGQNN